jgi:ketosteroid isomerase-like protein
VSDRDTRRLDIVRRSYEAFNRQDFDLAVKHAHPEIEYLPVDGQEPIRGRSAYRQWMEPDAFDAMVTTLLGVELCGDQILVRQLAKARGAGSGIEMEVVFFTVFTFDDDDRVIRAQAFLPHQEAEARRAAGMAT